MTATTWGDVILGSFQNLGVGLIAFLPQFVVALVIFLLGWIIGALLGRVVSQILKSLKVDEALGKTGLERALERGGVVLDSGGFIGGLVKWFIIIAFLVAAFEVLGLTQVNVFLQEVVLAYLPQVIIAVLVLVAAAVIGDVMQKVVSASAKTAGVKTANLLGSITRWAVWLFGISAALLHLGIAESLINTLFLGLVVALSLGLGLAFGLGGQEAAARFIAKVGEEVSER